MREANTLRSSPVPSMPWTGRRVRVALACATLLAGLAVLATFRGEQGDPAAATGATPAGPVRQSEGPVERSALPSPDVGRDTRGHATPAAPQSTSRQRFEQTNDLYAFAQSLAPALDRGEPEAIWLMSRVIETCAGHAADPAAFARDSERLGGMRLATSAAMRAARERVRERCRRFAAGDDLSASSANRLRLQAADAGSLVAEAELFGMGQPLAEGQDYADELVVRVRDSLDAEAFRAISPAMGGSAGLGVFSQPGIAPQFRELVWQLAACRLGLDCGPDSALMTSYCVNGGICSHDDRQGFEAFVYDAAIPRQSADLVRSMVDMLVRGNGGE